MSSPPDSIIVRYFVAYGILCFDAIAALSTVGQESAEESAGSASWVTVGAINKLRVIAAAENDKTLTFIDLGRMHFDLISS